MSDDKVLLTDIISYYFFLWKMRQKFKSILYKYSDSNGIILFLLAARGARYDLNRDSRLVDMDILLVILILPATYRLRRFK